MNAKDNEMTTLTEHLHELRRRVLWSVVMVIISMTAGLLAAKPLLRYLMSTSPVNDLPMNAFSPLDAVGIWLKLAFIIGLPASLPFVLYHLWAFVRPGLRPEERRSAVKYIPYSVLCFVAGFAFAYFVVFPMAFRFATDLTRNMGLSETYGISQYFSFMYNILLPLSLLFELPIVILFLTHIRVINPKLLIKFRRVAYLLLLTASTILTPPDVISDLLVALPLIALFELSVLLSGMVYRRQQRAEPVRDLPIMLRF